MAEIIIILLHNFTYEDNTLFSDIVTMVYNGYHNAMVPQKVFHHISMSPIVPLSMVAYMTTLSGIHRPSCDTWKALLC